MAHPPQLSLAGLLPADLCAFPCSSVVLLVLCWIIQEGVLELSGPRALAENCPPLYLTFPGKKRGLASSPHPHMGLLQRLALTARLVLASTSLPSAGHFQHMLAGWEAPAPRCTMGHPCSWLLLELVLLKAGTQPPVWPNQAERLCERLFAPCGFDWFILLDQIAGRASRHVYKRVSSSPRALRVSWDPHQWLFPQH